MIDYVRQKYESPECHLHSFDDGRERLAADGFSVLVVDRSRLKNDEIRDRVRERIRPVLGSPLERDGRWVYPLK